jgi:hypothetical protein
MKEVHQYVLRLQLEHCPRVAHFERKSHFLTKINVHNLMRKVIVLLTVRPK